MQDIFFSILEAAGWHSKSQMCPTDMFWDNVLTNKICGQRLKIKFCIIIYSPISLEEKILKEKCSITEPTSLRGITGHELQSSFPDVETRALQVSMVPGCNPSLTPCLALGSVGFVSHVGICPGNLTWERRERPGRLGEKEPVHPLLQWAKRRKTPKWDLGTWATETACIQVVPTPVTMGTLVQEKKKNLAQNPDSGVYLEPTVNWGPQRQFLFRQRTRDPEHEMCQQEMSDQNWDLGAPQGLQVNTAMPSNSCMNYLSIGTPEFTNSPQMFAKKK